VSQLFIGRNIGDKCNLFSAILIYQRWEKEQNTFCDLTESMHSVHSSQLNQIYSYSEVKSPSISLPLLIILGL